MILIADSGSTKTDWCCKDNRQGMVSVHTQGINPIHSTEREIIRVLNGELLPQIDGDSIDEIHFFGSGCRPELVPVMNRALAGVFVNAKVIAVDGDLMGAAKALWGDRSGIACIMGTGANSGVYDGHAITANIPPLGYVLGDEGSGAVLGCMLINAIYKGRVGQDIRRAFEDYAHTDIAGVIDRVYRKPHANKFLASLSPFVADHISNPCIEQVVKDNFSAFFKNNILPYNSKDLSIGAVGSIAWHYRAQLEAVADEYGLIIEKVVKSPIDGLVDYYL